MEDDWDAEFVHRVDIAEVGSVCGESCGILQVQLLAKLSSWRRLDGVALTSESSS